MKCNKGTSNMGTVETHPASIVFMHRTLQGGPFMSFPPGPHVLHSVSLVEEWKRRRPKRNTVSQSGQPERLPTANVFDKRRFVDQLCWSALWEAFIGQGVSQRLLCKNHMVNKKATQGNRLALNLGRSFMVVSPESPVWQMATGWRPMALLGAF